MKTRKRIVTVPHPTLEGMVEDWEIEEEDVSDKIIPRATTTLPRATASLPQTAFDYALDPIETILGHAAPTHQAALPIDGSPTDNGTTNQSTTGPAATHASDNDNNAVPMVPFAPAPPHASNASKSFSSHSPSRAPRSPSQAPGSPEMARSVPKTPAATFATTTATTMVPSAAYIKDVQRYVNARAIETARPLRDFFGDLAAKMGLADVRLFYKNGKLPEQTWLIRHTSQIYSGNDLVQHNAGHLSLELLLEWIREYHKDNGPMPKRTKRVGAGAGANGSTDLLIDASRAAAGTTIFDRARALRQQFDINALGPVVDTPPWHFHLLNFDTVKDMMLSDLGKSALRTGLEALQYHIPDARHWTIEMILVSPVVRVYFAWWVSTLLKYENANGYPGRIYTRPFGSGGMSNGGSGGGGGTQMALNISSGVTYLRIQSKLLRGYQKVFSSVYARTHPRILDMEAEVANLETAYTKIDAHVNQLVKTAQQPPPQQTPLQAQQLTQRIRGLSKTRDGLGNRLNDARTQLDELRIKLPKQLV